VSGQSWGQDLIERSAQLGQSGAINPAQVEFLQRLVAEVGALTRPRGTVRSVVVRSAVPLTEQERSRLEFALAQRFPEAGPVSYEVDPQLLGGVWLRVGDRIIDGSLRGRLEDLRQHLA